MNSSLIFLPIAQPRNISIHRPKNSLLGGFCMDQNFLTIPELAERLKVPKSWLYSRTRETGPGAIPRVKVGKYIRFVESDVMDWLKKQNEEG
jgi:excisionase family DNA binding protein